MQACLEAFLSNVYLTMIVDKKDKMQLFPTESLV